MIRLILHEGKSYSAEEIRTQVIQNHTAHGFVADFPEEQSMRVAKRIIEALTELKLPSTQLPTASVVPVSEDAENEDALDDERDEDNRVYLARPTRNGGLALRHLVGSATLQWQQSDDLPPVAIEVLPKIRHRNEKDDRAGLRRMWEYACDLNLREEEKANKADDARMPLHEWLIQRFLEQVDQLLARGIRAQYVEHEDNLLTVRGRLSIQENLRQNAHAPHRFFCRFEEFSPNRPENRLIKSAILAVRAHTQVPATRRRAAHLAEWLHEVPVSADISRDFALWQTGRLMTQYLEIRPTCEWILRSLSATPVAGRQPMFGRFVRMNDVFERYVVRWSGETLASSSRFRIYDQVSAPDNIKTLYEEPTVGKKDMQPDMRIYDGKECVAILDAKWKAPSDGQTPSDGDLYQMFAYAYHWLALPHKTEEMKLIGLVYPTADESRYSAHFSFPALKSIKSIAGGRLRFLLPKWDDATGKWREGFLVTRDEGFPFFSSDAAQDLICRQRGEASINQSA